MVHALTYPPADASVQWFAGAHPGTTWDALEKLVTHTTEGSGWPSYDGGLIAPNWTALPDMAARRLLWRQHFPANMSSRALVNVPGGVQTNLDHAVQAELVGTCIPGGPGLYWPGAPDWALQGLADFVRWLHTEWGLALTAAPLWLPYADRTDRQRFTGPAWDEFRGVCFTGDMLVTTWRGQVPISEIVVGDEVLTHKGRFRPVTALHQHVATTGLLVGNGHPGLRTTAEHPFLSTSSKLKHRRAEFDPNRAMHLVHTDPEWVAADSLVGRYWATPVAFPPADVPDVIQLRGKGRRRIVAMTPELMRLAGRYVADGCMGSHRRVLICAAHEEEYEVTDLCRSAGFDKVAVYHRSRPHTGIQVAVNSVSFAAWLLEHFGQHAHAKHIPTWLLGAPQEYREAFLMGYLDGDGHWEPSERFEAKTVSKSLAIGVRLLASSLGYAVSLYLLPPPAGKLPGGRVCRTREQWRVKGSKKFGRGTATKVIGEHRYSRVRSWLADDEPTTVFNISVKEDESYVVDGIVVHNCGHEHVPENDHKDPADLPIRRVLEMAGAADMDLEELATWDVSGLVGQPAKTVNFQTAFARTYMVSQGLAQAVGSMQAQLQSVMQLAQDLQHRVDALQHGSPVTLTADQVQALAAAVAGHLPPGADPQVIAHAVVAELGRRMTGA